ncbi:hypothetical protein [Yersinia phage fHe-Yen9-03]|uniref:Uncharacterized protein n=1 Tax=Yersinia phage fHe-Yen9-03 TaxID=2052743 RepID=A0A2C9CYI4_9CAUD|nr:hypothetical protein [Yersinia phage fHe-Yen9-03]
MLDYKKYSVKEFIEYAREQNKTKNNNSFVLGYDNECDVYLISKYQNMGNYRACVYSKYFSVANIETGKYIFYYCNFKNTVTHEFENVSFSTKYNNKTKTYEIKSKTYKLNNKSIDIETNSQIFTTIYDDLRIKERLYRNGCKFIEVSFPIVTYVDGKVHNRTYGETYIHETYNSKGVCTFCNFSFSYKGNRATIQMYYKKGASFWMSSGTGNTDLYLRDNIKIPELKEVGIEYLYNDFNMWNIDLRMVGSENFECFEYAKSHLIKLLTKHSKYLSTALDKIKVHNEA